LENFFVVNTPLPGKHNNNFDVISSLSQG